MGRENRLIGDIGERLASEHLRRTGYKILGNNIRTPFGELDIVAKKDGLIVFVEVKTRSTSSLGPPFLSVTWSKQRSIVRNALFYLKGIGMVYSNWRVDIVSVKLDSSRKTEKIEIIENAVEDS